MYKLKIIQEKDIKKLEKQINEFCIKKNIFDIKIEIHSNENILYTALIFYEVKE